MKIPADRLKLLFPRTTAPEDDDAEKVIADLRILVNRKPDRQCRQSIQGWLDGMDDLRKRFEATLPVSLDILDQWESLWIWKTLGNAMLDKLEKVR